jgi:hypothetical protein
VWPWPWEKDNVFGLCAVDGEVGCAVVRGQGQAVYFFKNLKERGDEGLPEDFISRDFRPEA